MVFILTFKKKRDKSILNGRFEEEKSELNTIHTNVSHI